MNPPNALIRNHWRDWFVSSGFHAVLGIALVWGMSNSSNPSTPIALDVSIAWALPDPPPTPAPAPAPTAAAATKVRPVAHAPKIVQTVAPRPTPAIEPAAPDTVIASAPTVSAPVATPMGPLTAPDPTAQVTKPAPSGINSVQKPADTSRWQAQLESMLRKHKQYPMVARRMRQEGIVTVEAHFSAHGELIRCMVIISSGFKSLDEAALALVRQTADLVRASDQPGRSAELRIPIAFELKES